LGGQYARFFHLEIEEFDNNTLSEKDILTDFIIIPNPMRKNAEIRFVINKASNVKMTIFDITGSTQDIILEGFMMADSHRLQFNNNLSSGIYFINVQINGVKTRTEKIIVK